MQNNITYCVLNCNFIEYKKGISSLSQFYYKKDVSVGIQYH